MKKSSKFYYLLVGLAFFLFIFNFHKFFSDNLLKSNVLSRSQRASFLHQSSSISQGRTAKNLIAVRKQKAWRSEINSPFPHIFVFELAGAARISSLKFNNWPENIVNKKAVAKDISAEFSTTHKDSGYTPAGAFSLEISEKSQEFKIKKKKARWIRISILSNHGNPRMTELSRVEAWGVFYFNPFRIISNFLWVLGIVTVFTALSYHEFVAYTKKEKIKDILKRESRDKGYYFGAILIIFGIIALIQNAWFSVILGAVCFLLLIWFFKRNFLK